MGHSLLVAVRAIHQLRRGERVVAAAHIALGFTGLLLGNRMFCHV